jgi:uncharacterized glyoxalase superfamily protein PhnB
MSAERAAQVVPNLYVDSVETLRTFYLEKLGFQHMMGIVGKDGNLDFAIVTRDGAMIMLARPQAKTEGTGPKYPTGRPLEIYIEVKDVDAFHEAVRSRAVAVKQPLTTQWWGDRNFAVQDPYGYVLWFYQNVGQPVPPPGVKMV